MTLSNQAVEQAIGVFLSFLCLCVCLGGWVVGWLLLSIMLLLRAHFVLHMEK